MPYTVVSRVNKPDDLLRPTPVANGKLPNELLVKMGNWRLHHRAADAWVAMCDAAFREQTIVLSPSSGGDSYRSYQAQVTGFENHYQLTALPGRPTKQWKGQTWYLKSGYYEAGTPGTSNHGWGLAIDVAGLAAEPVNPLSRWVLDNYGRFGFSHEHRDKSDPPHIRYFAGDEGPPDVSGRRRRRRTRGFPKFDPEFGLFSLWPIATNKPDLFLGAEGRGVRDPIRYAQGVLLNKLGYLCDVNGEFDERMENFVIWLQTVHDLEPTGRVERDTWALIDFFAG